MLKNKSFFLDQHGCAKNQVDGELIISRLVKDGMVRVDDPTKADVIIVNSCGFIESAKIECINSVMDYRSECPGAKILLAGCLAERYAKNEEFSGEFKEADGFFGNGDLSLVNETVDRLLEGERTVVIPEQKGVCCGDRDVLLSFNGSAYVKITEGCNNNCSFCAIPIIRGELRSRKCSEIVEEIKNLISRGIHEINLIGQDLAAYGCGKDDDVFGTGKNWYESIYTNLRKPLVVNENFSKENGKSFLLQLMEEISKIEGDFWVRLLYIHPDHFCADILEFMQKDKRFLPYFDIPFQSGSSEVIGWMNRKGSSEDYALLVKKIRDALPGACIRTTFLTGFPGETDSHAEETQKFLRTIESDWSGCFAFSPEDETAAFEMEDQVDEDVAKARAEKLQEIQTEITRERLKARVGQNYEVIVEEIIQNLEGTDEGIAIGRAWFDAPEVDGNVIIRYDLDDKRATDVVVPGNIVKVRAFASSDVDIDSELILN